jgi:hypothetical protein
LVISLTQNRLLSIFTLPKRGGKNRIDGGNVNGKDCKGWAEG